MCVLAVPGKITARYMPDEGEQRQWCVGVCVCVSRTQGDDALPAWLQEAAAEMAAGGATTSGSNTSFGYQGFVGSGTACSAAIDLASGGLLDHVRSMLLLRPVSLHDVWLRKVG